MERITFCIPTKNNLRYLKVCIPSIRENAYRKDHEIIIFVDEDRDGTGEWLEENKEKYGLTVFYNTSKDLYGIGRAYDFCIEKSPTDVFMVFHADMVLGKNADFEAYRLLGTSGSVVCSTRIEPPLHPNNGEKIIRNFGIWPEEFNKQAFDGYVESKRPDKGRVTDGIFAPWMMYKREFRVIAGGHDPIFRSAREDSDLFNRLLLTGFTFKQSWDSLVYHFTGRGGQFQHGQIEGEKDREWQILMQASTREFIRKWGTNVLHTPLMKPIVVSRYHKTIILENATPTLLYVLEPWADHIHLDIDTEEYKQKEALLTSFPLDYRIRSLAEPPSSYSDVVVYVDGKTFEPSDHEQLQQLSLIVERNPQAWGRTIRLGNMKISIKDTPKDYSPFLSSTV